MIGHVLGFSFDSFISSVLMVCDGVLPAAVMYVHNDGDRPGWGSGVGGRGGGRGGGGRDE